MLRLHAFFSLALLIPLAPASAAAGDAGGYAGWPRVTQVGVAAPDVLHVVVRTGEVIRGGQGPYESQPDDEIVETDRNVIVRRGGDEYGALAWSDRTLFTPFERVIQAPFTPERWRQVTRMVVRSEDDPAYGDGRRPERVEMKTRPYEVSRVGSWEFEAPLEHHFFVLLPTSAACAAPVCTASSSRAWARPSPSPSGKTPGARPSSSRLAAFIITGAAWPWARPGPTTSARGGCTPTTSPSSSR